MTEWQPIETAPKKNGKKGFYGNELTETILLFVPQSEPHVFVGSWDFFYDISVDGRGIDYYKVNNGFQAFEAWVSTEGELIHRSYGKPTHWMPLPELPGATESKDLGYLIDKWTEEDTRLRNGMQALVSEFADEAARCTTASEAAVWALAKSMLEERLNDRR
jgi:hypothetical protein